MHHRLIALAALVLGAAGIVAPAHADGWSAWKTFASHNGVVVEWRTYSHPNRDPMADWRVTNNSDESLWHLSLGRRDYTCSNGSSEYALGDMLGSVEFKPGDSDTLGQDGAANWVRADQFDRDSCHSIVEAHFESKAAILEFALGPDEQVKPWTEYSFTAEQLSLTCNWPQEHECVEATFERNSEYIEYRDYCVSADGETQSGALCAKTGAFVCKAYYREDGAVYIHYWYEEYSDDQDSYLEYLCHRGEWEAEYMGYQ